MSETQKSAVKNLESITEKEVTVSKGDVRLIVLPSDVDFKPWALFAAALVSAIHIYGFKKNGLSGKVMFVAANYTVATREDINVDMNEVIAIIGFGQPVDLPFKNITTDVGPVVALWRECCPRLVLDPFFWAYFENFIEPMDAGCRKEPMKLIHRQPMNLFDCIINSARSLHRSPSTRQLTPYISETLDFVVKQLLTVFEDALDTDHDMYEISDETNLLCRGKAGVISITGYMPWESLVKKACEMNPMLISIAICMRMSNGSCLVGFATTVGTTLMHNKYNSLSERLPRSIVVNYIHTIVSIISGHTNDLDMSVLLDIASEMIKDQ